MSLMNVGNVLRDMGKYEEALVEHQRLLDIKTRILGGDNHPLVARTHTKILLCCNQKLCVCQAGTSSAGN